MLPLFLLSTRAQLDRRKVSRIVVIGFLCMSLSILLLWTKRQRSEDLVEVVRESGSAVITTSWLLPGEFADLQAEGIPVVMADRSGPFLSTLDSFSALNPVIVCLEQDLQTTLDVIGERKPGLSIKMVMAFDPSLRVAVIVLHDP
jgi:hypothetical protein